MKWFLGAVRSVFRYALVVPLAVGYYLIFFLFQSNSQVFAKQLYDTFFSSDEGYYFLQLFRTPTPNWDGQIARHPVYAVIARLLGKVIDLVAQWNAAFESPLQQYGLIIAVQCVVMALAVILVYRYLVDVVELDRLLSTLLAGMFACSMSSIVFSMIVETYSWSGLFLVLMVYVAHKVQSERTQTLSQIGIGAVLSGLTVTNGVVWGMNAVLQGYRSPRRLVARLVGGGLLLLALLATHPLFTTLLTQGLPALAGTTNTWLQHYAGFGWVQQVYHFLLEAPLFAPIVQAQAVLDNTGQGVVFLPRAYIPVLVAGLVWTGLLGYAAMTAYRDKRTWILYGVLGFTFWLHGVKQFGLNEAFLYSQHHLFAQVLLVGYGIKPWQSRKWMVALLLAVLLLVEIGANTIALRDMLGFAMQYAPK